MKSKLVVYKQAIALLTKRGLKPQPQKLDNEASGALQQFVTSVDIDHQLVRRIATTGILLNAPFDRST
jgi:hypothetical protein